MIEQAPVLIIVFPLVFAFITPLLGLIKKSLCYPWAVLALGLSSAGSFITLITIFEKGEFNYRMGRWAPPWGIELSLDLLSGAVLVVVTVISLLTVISSKKIVEKEIPGKFVHFYTIFLLQVTGFLGIVITGDMFNLYVFLEIASLTGYALIAIGEEHAAYASFKYLVMGTIGASFYLLGVGYLYMATGTLNMADMANMLPPLSGSSVVLAAFVFFMIGVAIKMAMPPLHSWLPDAYTYAPSATSALVAPLMTKISVYIIIRVMFKVFNPSFSTEIYPVTDILGWLAVFGILFAGVMALAQVDIKRIFSYLIMAEIGYIVIGLASANRIGFTGALLHVINDIFMMSCLFLFAAAVYYQTGTRSINEFFRLHRKMPVTLAVFMAGALAVVGIPPFCGFFSKWYLILGTIAAEKWILLSVIIISSLINAVIFFRIIERAYIEPREEEGHARHYEAPRRIVSPDRVPASMLVPMIIVAVCIILLGFFSGTIVTRIIEPVIPAAFL